MPFTEKYVFLSIVPHSSYCLIQQNGILYPMPLVSSFYEFTLTEDYMLQFTTQCKIKKKNKQTKAK